MWASNGRNEGTASRRNLELAKCSKYCRWVLAEQGTLLPELHILWYSNACMWVNGYVIITGKFLLHHLSGGDWLVEHKVMLLPFLPLAEVILLEAALEEQGKRCFLLLWLNPLAWQKCGSNFFPWRDVSKGMEQGREICMQLEANLHPTLYWQ